MQTSDSHHNDSTLCCAESIVDAFAAPKNVPEW
jgi:hypothetical protein